MARSFDSRKLPGGPVYDEKGRRPFRGVRRFGDLGRVTPGDELENTRDHERLWQWLTMLQRKLSSTKKSADDAHDRLDDVDDQLDDIGSGGGAPDGSAHVFHGEGGDWPSPFIGFDEEVGAWDDEGDDKVEEYKRWYDLGFRIWARGIFEDQGGGGTFVESLGLRVREAFTPADGHDFTLGFYFPKLSSQTVATPWVKCDYVPTGMADGENLELNGFVATTSLFFGMSSGPVQIMWAWFADSVDSVPRPVPDPSIDGETPVYDGATDQWVMKRLGQVRKNSTGTSFQRPRLNLIEGANVTLTVADDAGDDEVDVTIASTASAYTQKGTWSGATTYILNDVVELNGSSYVCVSAHTNHTPPNVTYWQLVASKGDTGITGTTGTTGTTGATGAAGASALHTTLVSQWHKASLPLVTGADGAIWRVPYLAGGATGTFTVVRISIHLETPGSTQTVVKVQKCASGTNFTSAVDIGGVTAAASANDASNTSVGLGSCGSGDMLRVNFTDLGTDAQKYTVELEGYMA